MAISVIADVHLANHAKCGGPLVGGINTRARMILDVLREAVQRAPAGHLFVLGDLFDTSKPEPVLIAAVQDIFGERKDDLAIHLLVGNHDASSEAKDHNAMAPLKTVATVHEKPCRLGGIQGQPDILLLPYNVNVVEQLEHWLPTSYKAVLVFAHCGIKDDGTPFFLKEDKNAIHINKLREFQRDFPGFIGFAAGDWHVQKLWRRDLEQLPDITQVGALVPTGWDNPDMFGYGAISTWSRGLGDVGWSSYRIRGPRFFDSLFDGSNSTAQGHTPFVRLRVPASEVEQAKARCEKFKGLGGYTIEVVKEDKVSTAEVAQLGAQLSVDEAIHTYLAKSFKDEEARKKLYTLVKGYLENK